MRKRLHLPVFLLALTASLTPMTANAAEPTTLLDADFSVLTQGSVENPVEIPSYGTGSISTFFTGWSSSKAFQAGGQLKLTDGGYVQTSRLTMTTSQAVKVSMRVRALDSYGGMVNIQIGYAAAQSVMLNGDQYQDISLVTTTSSSSANVKVSPFLSAAGLLISNLKVEQSADFMPSPTIYTPTDFNGTSFTARWKAVSGATQYLINVFSYNSTGDKVFAVKDEAATGTSKKIEELTEGPQYWYTVSASNGTAVSDPSQPEELIKRYNSINAPTNVKAIAKDGVATASWNSVPEAEKYVVTVNRYETMLKAGAADILNENFSKVTVGTLESVEFIFRTDGYTQQEGWEGENLAAAAGHLVLSPHSNEAHLSTPVLDLSKSDGEFTAYVNMAEGQFGTYYAGATLTASIIDAEGNTLESKDITLEQGFKTYDIAFTKGTAACRLKLSYSGSRKVFFDEITISQVVPAGTVIKTQFLIKETEDTNIDFQIVEAENIRYTVSVQSVVRTVDSSGNEYELYSEPTDETNVESGEVGVDTAIGDAVRINVLSDGSVTVNLTEASLVEIYTLEGRKTASAFITEGNGVLNPGFRGVAIVRINNNAVKVIL